MSTGNAGVLANGETMARAKMTGGGMHGEIGGEMMIGDGDGSSSGSGSGGGDYGSSGGD